MYTYEHTSIEINSQFISSKLFIAKSFVSVTSFLVFFFFFLWILQSKFTEESAFGIRWEDFYSRKAESAMIAKRRLQSDVIGGLRSLHFAIVTIVLIENNLLCTRVLMSSNYRTVPYVY